MTTQNNDILEKIKKVVLQELLLSVPELKNTQIRKCAVELSKLFTLETAKAKRNYAEKLLEELELYSYTQNEKKVLNLGDVQYVAEHLRFEKRAFRKLKRK